MIFLHAIEIDGIEIPSRVPSLNLFHTQQSLDVFADDVELQIDRIASFKLTKVGMLEAIRNDRDPETVSLGIETR